MIEVGRCYWYKPTPTENDPRCSFCGFIFGKDEEATIDDYDPVLVVIMHATRIGTSTCPACGTENALDLGFWRAKHLSRVNGGFADLDQRWLELAEPDAIAEYFIADEDQVDGMLDGGFTPPLLPSTGLRFKV